MNVYIILQFAILSSLKIIQFSNRLMMRGNFCFSFVHMQSLMDYCFKFSCQHMTQVVHSEGYTELDGSLAKQLFVRAAENGILKT